MARLALALLLVLLLPASARAAWQAPLPLDGPNPDVAGLGGVDVARDGTGGIAYLKRDGGVAHVFVTRLTGGAWTGPVRVDPTAGAATEAQIAAGDADRLAVAWITDGTVYATVATAGQYAPVVALGGPDASSLDVDMGVNGVAYAVWQQAGDVRAARLLAGTWTPLATPLDVLPAMAASAPRVTVSAEGFAFAAWVELNPDGRTHVYARRLLGTALSAYPVDATLDGGNADSPDVTTEWDSSFAWVAWRQDEGGASHTYARQYLGSRFEPAVPLDGGQPSDSPHVSVDGGGEGAAVVEAGAAVLSPVLAKSVFGAPTRLDGGGAGPPSPVISATDEGDVATVWRVLDGDGVWRAHGRFLAAGAPYEPDTLLSSDALGPVADPGVALSGDRVGDYVAAMVQGPDGARTLAVTVFDRPPGRPSVPTSTAFTRLARPSLRWGAGLDLWGTQTFNVYIDTVLAGQTQGETFRPAARLASGTHRFRVDAIDRAGQITGSHTRTIKIDALAPRISLKISGRRAHSPVTVKVKATDRGGAGLDHVTVDYGDRSSARAATSRHAYQRAGRYTLTVAAVDRAGNVVRRSVKLRIG